MSLTPFHPVIADWFRQKFGTATEPQAEGWPHIAAERDTLIAAPTGSGKTLAAFLTAIDRLFRMAVDVALTDEVHVVYVSPLKALANDVQKNLEQPLQEICNLAIEYGFLLPEIRVAVRSGDTLNVERQRILRRPPHILVTTPESLYLLLTAERSRRMLPNVHTVIVDEIHAVAGNKRGSHLSLSLARLDALVTAAGNRPPVRIGLSATVRPLETIGEFLVGSNRKPPVIVQVPTRRDLDLAVEVPRSDLGPIATNDQWEDRFDRLAVLAGEHRSTLVFVSTRALAERVAHRMRERLGEDAVAAHHGSLSRKIRLMAEDRFKRGELRMMVATASLELGLDIGSIDLVCQIGSPRALAAAWQRIGRAGHWKGATPKGRFFPTTLDDLIECAALIRALRAGQLDELAIPPWPRDILAQQMVATVATGEWHEDDLYALVRQAYPYRDLPRTEFERLVEILSDGISHRRGRSGAYLHRDGVHRKLRPRRGARLAAITSGGAIPENALYTVVAEPENVVVGTLDEDFAVESNAGDVILLGTTSWLIRGVESGGRVRVENAHGAPPTVPFWLGEAPGRTPELSDAVARVRTDIARVLEAGDDTGANAIERAVEWLQKECTLDRLGAVQAAMYVHAGVRALGVVPATRLFVAERFFDEGGGMQLVIHAPLGSRINKAWGMALRKSFCRNFDFELQASASENGLVLSLSEQHSFPLETIFSFVHSGRAEETLEQAILQSPLFQTRWRWDAGRALALLRYSGGRKIPPQIQRLRSEDLLAAVFPLALGCQDNHGGGDIPLPDHPYIAEAMRDCLHEALDFDGLQRTLRQIESGEIRLVAIDTPAPSVFSHEILNAAPYSYLDDAPLEERRTRAVNLRRSLDVDSPAGSLDPAAIVAVCEEAWPDPENADEVHDVLLSLLWLPEPEALPAWQKHLDELVNARRVYAGELGTRRGWVAAERIGTLRNTAISITAGETDRSGTTLDSEEAYARIVRGWMEIVGPTTAQLLGQRLGLETAIVDQALLRLETEGQVLRGHFHPGSRDEQGAPALEWCDRRLLARIHRRTLNRLRAEIEPVSPAVFMRFLMRWQHVEPHTRLHGPQGLLTVLTQLQGFEAAATAWESRILRARVADYSPEMLDVLCLSGEIAWARISPPISLAEESVRRIVPTKAAPITFFRREDAPSLLVAAGWDASAARARVSPPAAQILATMEKRGACFFADLARLHASAQTQEGSDPHLLKSQIEQALWELASAGLVTADGFDNLRALIDTKRRRAEGSGRTGRPRHSAGRWSPVAALVGSADPAALDPYRRLELAEFQARQLLRRYGVIFRALMARESTAVSWHDILVACRRLEARGELRGGRFVSGFSGEQYALPEAVEALRAARRLEMMPAPMVISASDPLNLVGIIVPGERIPAQADARVVLIPAEEGSGATATVEAGS